MADQTVSLTLTADAESLKAALRESGELMDELGGKSEDVADKTSDGLSGLSGFWSEHSEVITGVGIAAGAAGAGLEALIRRQQDTRAEAGRLAAILDDETTDSIMRLAAESHDATTDLDELVEMMMTGRQQGLDSGRDLQAYAEFWDMIGDATGESAGQLAEASTSLRTVGVAAGEEAGALDAFGFIAGETTTSVSEFLRILERVGPDLNDMGGGIDDAAALLGILEEQFGLSGRQARREFETAIRDSDGTMQGLLDTLGISQEVYDEYMGKVAESSDVIRDQADAYAESRTPMQRLTASFESFLAANSGVVEGLGALTPILLGAGGLVVGMQKLTQFAGPTATALGKISQNATGAESGLRGVGRAVGIAAVAWAAGEALEYVNEQLLDLALGAPVTSDELALAADGIVAFGEAPESVSGAFDDLGGALDTVNALGHDFTQTLDGIPVLGTALSLVDPSFRGEIEMLERADEVTRQFGDALATAVREGNTERLAVLMSELGDATGLSGDALEEFAREQWPEYAQAIDRVALDTADASDEVEALGDAFDDTGDQTLTAAEAIDEYLDAVRRATDPVFRLIDAIDKVDQAQENYNETMADAEASLEDQQAAAIEVMRALEDLERAAIDGDLSFEEFERQLDRWVAQGGLTEQMAAQIRDRVAEARGEAETFQGTYTVTINATGNAWENMRALVRMRAELSGGDRSRTDYGRTRRARGGPVWPGEEFLVGEEGPELVTFGKSGFVHDAQTTAQMMAGPSTTTTSSVAVTQNFNVQPDAVALFRARDEARTLAEVMA